MKKKVAIIVVTYNRLSFLKECIESLRKQIYKDYTIIVINNGSTDDTAEWLSEQDDLITITQPNLGGAGGFFTGIKYACENGYEYSWIMDDDVEAIPDTLEKLMLHVSKTKGFLCSNVVDTNNIHCNVPRITRKTSSETGEWIWGNLLTENMIGVDVTSFVSVLIPNVIVRKLGLPYKEYFIWGDDTEYTRRISDYYDSYMVIDSVMVHKRKLTSELSIFTEENPNRIKMYYYYYRNRIHGSKGIIRKLGLYCWGIMDVARLVFKGNLKRALIVLRGCNASIIFHPKKIYPNT